MQALAAMPTTSTAIALPPPLLRGHPSTHAAASHAAHAASNNSPISSASSSSPLPEGGLFFVDTFAAYPLGPLPTQGPWNTTTNHGTVAIALKDGVKAAKLSTQPGEGGKTAFLSLASVPFGQAYFGRFRFFLEAAPTTHDLHWTFVQGSGLVQDSRANESYVADYRFGGQLALEAGSQLMANLDTPGFYGGHGPGTDCWMQGRGAVMPAGRWVCAEFAFTGEDTEHVGMRLWLDGAEVQSVTVEPTEDWRGEACVHQEAASYAWPAPKQGFERLDLGWESYNKDEEKRDMWIRDVALGQTRVGCDA